MANLIVSTNTTEAEIVRALVPQFMDTVEGYGSDLYITGADNGLRFHTGNGKRSAIVIGHSILENTVRITWRDEAHNEFSWDEDITTHSLGSLFGVTEALVRFVCDDKWPEFCTRHRKSRPRVTDLPNDKPYGTVEVVILVSSSCETMALYKDYKETKMTYKQDMGGYMHTIGHINDRPICITPLVHVIDGVNVLYVEATSGLVDWEMIEDWVKARVPEGTQICNDPCNAISYIRTASRNKQ